MLLTGAGTNLESLVHYSCMIVLQYVAENTSVGIKEAHTEFRPLQLNKNKTGNSISTLYTWYESILTL